MRFTHKILNQNVFDGIGITITQSGSMAVVDGVLTEPDVAEAIEVEFRATRGVATTLRCRATTAQLRALAASLIYAADSHDKGVTLPLPSAPDGNAEAALAAVKDVADGYFDNEEI